MYMIQRIRDKRKYFYALIVVAFLAYTVVYTTFGSNVAYTIWWSIGEPDVESQRTGIYDLWDFSFLDTDLISEEDFSLGGVSPFNGIIFRISRKDSVRQKETFLRRASLIDMVNILPHHEDHLVYVKYSNHLRIEVVSRLCGEYMIELIPFGGRSLSLQKVSQRIDLMVPRCLQN